MPTPATGSVGDGQNTVAADPSQLKPTQPPLGALDTNDEGAPRTPRAPALPTTTQPSVPYDSLKHPNAVLAKIAIPTSRHSKTTPIITLDKDSQALLQLYSTIFTSYIGFHANSVCQSARRKKIKVDDVLSALRLVESEEGQVMEGLAEYAKRWMMERRKENGNEGDGQDDEMDEGREVEGDQEDDSEGAQDETEEDRGLMEDDYEENQVRDQENEVGASAMDVDETNEGEVGGRVRSTPTEFGEIPTLEDPARPTEAHEPTRVGSGATRNEMEVQGPLDVAETTNPPTAGEENPGPK